MYFLLFFQQLVASSTHLFAKHVTQTLHPAVIVFYRGAFSVALYLVWMLFRRKQVIRIAREDWLMIALLGLINMPLNQLMFVWGLKYTTAPNASLAYALSPAFVLIISHLMHGEKLGKVKTYGVAIAIIGTVIILAERGIDTGSDYLFGNIIELCASLAWSFYTVLGRTVAMKYGAIYTTALSMIAGFILFQPLYALLAVAHVPAAALSADEWFGLVYLGVITSGVGFALWYYLLTKLEATKVSVFNNLQPVMTTLLAFFITGHVPSLTFVIGGCVVLTGVIVTQRG